MTDQALSNSALMAKQKIIEKPHTVVIAVRLLWFSLVLGAITMVAYWGTITTYWDTIVYKDLDLTVLASTGISSQLAKIFFLSTMVYSFILNYTISIGRNWARILLLLAMVFVVIGLILPTGILPADIAKDQPIILRLSSILAYLLQLAAVYLLFSSPGSGWFKEITKQQELKRHLYYEKAFEKISKGKIITWNWSACFGGYIWCVYRKMYLRALLLALLSYPVGYIIGFVIGFAIGSASGSIMAHTGWSFQDVEKIVIVCSQIVAIISTFIIWSAVYGALGNYWYYKHLQKKVKKGYIKLSLPGVDKRSAICAIIPFLGWLSALLRFLSERRKLNKLKSNLPVEEFSDIPVMKEAVLSLV